MPVSNGEGLVGGRQLQQAHRGFFTKHWKEVGASEKSPRFHRDTGGTCKPWAGMGHFQAISVSAYDGNLA